MTSKPTKAAVVLCSGPNGLGAIRGLRKAGVPAIAVVNDAADPVCLSRYPIQKLVVSPSDDADAALLSALGKIRYERAVLIPTSDSFVSFMIRNSEALRSRFDFCLPDDSLALALLDKARETTLVANLRVPVPKTIQNLPPDGSFLLESLGLPLIAKPRSFAHRSHLGAKNRVIRSYGELQRFLDDYRNVLWAFLAQEFIPGNDHNQWVCNCVFGRAHELVSAFTFRRFGLAPAHRGVTSCAVSESNGQVVSLAARVGKGLRYTGAAMLEFKFDKRDGQYKYLELNPRLGMCNYFDTVCGVNNVYETYCLAAGRDSERNGRRQRDGVMYLCLFEDFYARIKDGETIGAIAGRYISGAWRPHVGAYFAWDDLAPGITIGWRRLLQVARSAWGKLLKGHSSAGARSNRKSNHNQTRSDDSLGHDDAG